MTEVHVLTQQEVEALPDGTWVRLGKIATTTGSAVYCLGTDPWGGRTLRTMHMLRHALPPIRLDVVTVGAARWQTPVRVEAAYAPGH